VKGKKKYLENLGRTGRVQLQVAVSCVTIIADPARKKPPQVKDGWTNYRRDLIMI